MGRLPLTLGEGYEERLNKILMLRPNLRNKTKTTEEAIDKYYEWLITFTKEERAVFKSHKKVHSGVVNK